MLQTLEPEFPVAGLHEQLPAKPRQGRKAQRCKHTGAVHILQTRLGVVTTWPHLRVIQRFGAELLLGLADDRAQSRAWHPLAVVDPDVHAVVVDLHVRRTVSVLGGNAVDPQIRRLEDVVVDRDQPVQVIRLVSVRLLRLTCNSPIDMCLTS